jgi:hypothetical protein
MGRVVNIAAWVIVCASVAALVAIALSPLAIMGIVLAGGR